MGRGGGLGGRVLRFVEGSKGGLFYCFFSGRFSVEGKRWVARGVCDTDGGETGGKMGIKGASLVLGCVLVMMG